MSSRVAIARVAAPATQSGLEKGIEQGNDVNVNSSTRCHFAVDVLGAASEKQLMM